MTWLVDTNVVSELRKRERADRRVVGWFRQRQSRELYISVLTISELRRGVMRIRRRDKNAARALDFWIGRILHRYRGRVLDINAAVAERWGRLGVPDPLPDVDGLIAATALTHDLIVVTRNTRDFERTGARCLDPFEPASTPR